MERVDADLVPFAQNNSSGYRFAFGTDTATDDINANYNDNIKKGWGTTPNEFPEVEDFNAFAYTSGYLTSYLYQMGISEWNNKQNYRQYSRVIGSDGKIYKAKTGTDLAPNVNLNPTTSRANWEIDTSNLLNTNITVTVGSGGQYTTINGALEYLSGLYPLCKTTGVTATISLLAGFVMAEQVLVRGLNLGWITITGADAETTITHTALTTDFTTADYGFASYPAFGVSKGGVLPRINQLFAFNVAAVGGGKHGIMTVGAGSSADIMANKGVRLAGTHGIYAASGSTINAQNANASSAGTHGIYAERGSTINAQNAIIQNQTGVGYRVFIIQGSTINANGIDTTGGTVPALSQTANTLTANGIIYQ